MPGVRIEVVCAQCGCPTRMATQTITQLRTKGHPLLCADCRAARDRAWMLAYSRTHEAQLRAGRERVTAEEDG